MQGLSPLLEHYPPPLTCAREEALRAAMPGRACRRQQHLEHEADAHTACPPALRGLIVALSGTTGLQTLQSQAAPVRRAVGTPLQQGVKSARRACVWLPYRPR